MVLRGPIVTGFVLVTGAIAFGASACGTDAHGSDACRQIEEARCRQALGCNISLAIPVHQESDVDACIHFYDDACMHGLQAPDPGAPSVAACVNLINGQSDCNIVLHPEQYPPCAWLIPPATPPAADAGDGATDAPANVDAGE